MVITKLILVYNRRSLPLTVCCSLPAINVRSEKIERMGKGQTLKRSNCRNFGESECAQNKIKALNGLYESRTIESKNSEDWGALICR